MRSPGLLPLVAVLIAAPAPSIAQGARIVDAGSFSISINGQRAGREDFTIEATPRGSSMEHFARATVVYGDRRLQPQLMADSAGVALTYEIRTRNAGGGTESWKGSILRGRVSARMETARGPAAKEYIVTDGALILDDGVIHQYYFVARHRPAGAVTVVVPQRNAQLRLQISAGGDERVQVGTQELDATHVILTEPSGTQREVWVDRQGRVLKVAIPSLRLVALRDDPPR